MLSFHFFEFFKFWRENDVILLAPIFCLNVKTSLVNFSKVRCCVNFKTENIIELSAAGNLLPLCRELLAHVIFYKNSKI